MKTTVIPALKNSVFYVPVLAGGAMISKQLAKIPALQETVSSLESKVISSLDAFPGVSESLANFTVDASEFILGTAAILGLARSIKKSRKKKDFQRLISLEEIETSDSEVSDPELVERSKASKLLRFSGKTIRKTGRFLKKPVVASASATALLASGFMFPGIYDYLASQGQELVEKGGYALQEMLNNPAVKVVGGLLGIHASSWLYSHFKHKKHGPIMKRYYVDGWIPVTKKLHPLAFMVRRAGGIEFQKTRGMHSGIQFCATITSKDFRTGKKREMIMGYRSDQEPKRMKRKLEVPAIDSILHYLSEYMALEYKGTQRAGFISPSEVGEVAKNSEIYTAVERERFSEHKLDRFDTGRIIRGMSKSSIDNLLDPNLDKETLVMGLNKQRLWDIGGFFHCNVYDGSPLSLRVSLRENIPQSDAISRVNIGGYGQDYADKGKILMVHQFRTYEGANVEDDSAFLDEEHFDDSSKSTGGGTSVNVIREVKKGWNNVIKYGLGKAYIIFWEGETYVYDEWWTGSGKFITDLIPGLSGREKAIRRIGYIYDSKGRTVAKIADNPWMVWSKPILGNYDRRVDVYEPRLASNENFGALLCAWSRFLTFQDKYRRNRIQEVAPAGVSLSGADLDIQGQV